RSYICANEDGLNCLSDFDSEIRFHPRKANVVADALSRKERVRPRRLKCCVDWTTNGKEGRWRFWKILQKALETRLDMSTAYHPQTDGQSRPFCRLKLEKAGPFEILERVGPIAYRLRFPQELSNVHDIFHVLNLKKCLADANLHVPLDKIKVDKTLHFVEEPVEIMDREVKSLKRCKIQIVKVC
nr:putative reverse transcriptase domain-containing protein [Tanacetum cinerariifolium]